VHLVDFIVRNIPSINQILRNGKEGIFLLLVTQRTAWLYIPMLICWALGCLRPAFCCSSTLRSLHQFDNN